MNVGDIAIKRRLPKDVRISIVAVRQRTAPPYNSLRRANHCYLGTPMGVPHSGHRPPCWARRSYLDRAHWSPLDLTGNDPMTTSVTPTRATDDPQSCKTFNMKCQSIRNFHRRHDSGRTSLSEK